MTQKCTLNTSSVGTESQNCGILTKSDALPSVWLQCYTHSQNIYTACSYHMFDSYAFIHSQNTFTPSSYLACRTNTFTYPRNKIVTIRCYLVYSTNTLTYSQNNIVITCWYYVYDANVHNILQFLTQTGEPINLYV